jgi:hypothetical protein
MKAISNEYREMAIQSMSLNITDDEMFVLIPSERNNKSFYRVDMDEATLQPESCRCAGFSRWKKCKHVTLVAECFAFYKPAATPVVESASQEEEPKVTEIEANNFYIVNSNTQVWRTEDGQWMAVGPTENAIEIVESHLEKQQAVAEAEQIVAQVVEKPEPTQEVVSPVEPIPLKRGMMDAPLTSNSGFQMFKGGLLKVS